MCFSIINDIKLVAFWVVIIEKQQTLFKYRCDVFRHLNYGVVFSDELSGSKNTRTFCAGLAKSFKKPSARPNESNAYDTATLYAVGWDRNVISFLDHFD